MPIRENVTRVLIIRFSSFGDIVQALSVPSAVKRLWPQAHVSWLVRRDFASLVQPHAAVDEILEFDRRDGLGRLLRLAWTLGAGGYTHVYDAHNNLRSNVFLLLFFLRCCLSGRFAGTSVIQRPKHRLQRLLLFRLGLNLLPQPFRGVDSFLAPLKKWGYQPSQFPKSPQFFVSTEVRERIREKLAERTDFIALVPSAAWRMKRWPEAHWKDLIQLLPNENFVILGGPEDVFCEELAKVAPTRVQNLAGRLALLESAAVIELAKLTIANDTGLLHVADQLGRPNIGLIGPTAFGYTSHPRSQVQEVSLSCKPCSKDGRGRCKNVLYQRCMVEIEPKWVTEAATKAVTGAFRAEKSP